MNVNNIIPGYEKIYKTE